MRSLLRLSHGFGLAAGLSLALAACETGGKKKAGSDHLKNTDSEAAHEAKPEKGSDEQKASSTRVTVTSSLSNNILTSQTIAAAKAEAELKKYQGAKGVLGLEGLISSARLARKSSSDIVAAAHKLAEVEMEQGAGRTIPPDVKLEIALAAITSHNYALAAYYLDDLVDVKNPHLKAGAFNALGVIALRDDRVPEAVLYFREALKAVGNYKPALLNLGFSALKGGDIATAKSTLAKVEGDWFVQYGMISVARMDNDVGAAVDGCDRVLKKEPQHIAALFNCGLLEYQNKHNTAKAKEYLVRAGKAKGGEPDWAEKSFLLISKIDAESAQAKQEEARVKAAEAHQKAAKAASDKADANKPKEKPPAPTGAGSPDAEPQKADPGA